MTSPGLCTRRRFLRTGVLGGAVAWTIPAFLENTFIALDAAAADAAVQTATGKDGPILVILQLAGGNDGLNTVIPFADDAYHSARPKLALPAGRILKINDVVGLNPKLEGLRGLYDSGGLSIVQGVGYPNPNRSHFRSTDIWQTGSDAEKIEREGWIGRYFDSCCQGADPAVGISIGREAPLAFTAKVPTGVTMTRPEQFRFIASSDADSGGTEKMFRAGNTDDELEEEAGGSIAMLPSGRAAASNNALEFLRRTSLDAQVSSDRIQEITRRVRPGAAYPSSQLAGALSLVARLIAGGMPTRVYYVSQGGYDTHSGQAGAHDRLLAELDGALSAFAGDLRSQGNFERVLLMTFSEFGRRVAENSSGGTDHGAAAPLFLLGGALKPGLYGSQPSLTRLADGDLIHNVDFRTVYATVLEKWLGTPSEPVLKHRFPTLDFVPGSQRASSKTRA